MPRMIDADKLIDDYNKSGGTISDLMELILDAAEEATPPNDQMTPEELREMDGEPAWCKDCSRYGIICVDTKGIWEGIPFFSFRREGVDFCWNVDDRNLTIYRRKPEGR